jgi:hypothetical protein
VPVGGGAEHQGLGEDGDQVQRASVPVHRTTDAEQTGAGAEVQRRCAAETCWTAHHTHATVY